jgi:hypothetical protein
MRARALVTVTRYGVSCVFRSGLVAERANPYAHNTDSGQRRNATHSGDLCRAARAQMC